MADTNIWPQIDQALAEPGVLHPTKKHGRITVDFLINDELVTFAALRMNDERGHPTVQAKPPMVLSSAPETPDDALRWFLPELIQKAREILEAEQG